MSKANEPAFPEPYVNHPHLSLSIKGGLTQREYFAAMAMIGFCSNITGSHNPSVIAGFSVKMADALLEELKKQ